MLSKNLYFDVRDIFRTPRLAFGLKKIWLFLKANLFGFTIYWLLTNFALLLNGVKIQNSIDKFGLYPSLFIVNDPSILSKIVFALGILIWFLAIIYACAAVSRLTIKQLRGVDSYTVADARKFVEEHRVPIIMSWISILGIILFFLIIALIFSLIGKIPIVGELIFVLLYIVFFLGTIFTLYTLIVFIVSFIYSPVIVATMEEDTMSTVFQSYSLTWSQPWRLIIYNLILLPTLWLSIHFLILVWITAYKSINILFGLNWLMGQKANNIIAWASDLVIPKTIIFHGKYNFVYGFENTILSLKDGVGLSVPEYFVGTVLAIIFFLLIAFIVSYGLSILSVGETIIFTILKKKSDNENLLESKDEDSFILALDEDITKETDVSNQG